MWNSFVIHLKFNLNKNWQKYGKGSTKFNDDKTNSLYKCQNFLLGLQENTLELKKKQPKNSGVTAAIRPSKKVQVRAKQCHTTKELQHSFFGKKLL